MHTGSLQLLVELCLIGVIALCNCVAGNAQSTSKDVSSGTIVAVGGGGVPDGLMKHMIELAGGVHSHLVILPQASQLEDRGQDAAREFREQGAENVDIVELHDLAAARQKIDDADLIWFSGGDQSRLIDDLQKQDLMGNIHSRLRSGIVIGGTSAGAAVMSDPMITDSPVTQAIRSGNTPIGMGLGLAPGLIIDQHFVERERLNRLLSAVMDHPEKLGVGISERTAMILQDGQMRVLGDGSVIIIDARSARIENVEVGQLQTAREIRIHVLRSGDVFSAQPAKKQ